MSKYLLALVLGIAVSTAFANIAPLPKLIEPPRPVITYVDPNDVLFMPTPGEPNAVRVLCATLKGRGEVAITIGGATIMFVVNCPERSIAPFQ